MLNKENIILVTGATGTHGGAVAASLLKKGNAVRVIVRASSRNSKASAFLEQAGAEIVVADMDDPVSMELALEGIYGVFSVQGMDNGADSERRQADILAAAAIKKGVQHIVHASVNRTGDHERFVHKDRWNKKYWKDKQYAEEVIRSTGFAHWTILRPVFFMDNFLLPKANSMFPELAIGHLVVAYAPTTKLQLIAAEDTGVFASAAFNNAGKFDKQSIDLAGDELSINEIAERISMVSGKRISVEFVSEAEAVIAGVHPAFANAQEWNNIVGYNVKIEELKMFGLPITGFTQYLERNRHLLL